MSGDALLKSISERSPRNLSLTAVFIGSPFPSEANEECYVASIFKETLLGGKPCVQLNFKHCTISYVKGHVHRTPTKTFETPPPPCLHSATDLYYKIHATSLILSTFWGPPSQY